MLVFRSFTELVFRPFSELVFIYVVVVLVCLWEEVSSRSSYSSISVIPFFLNISSKASPPATNSLNFLFEKFFILFHF